MSHKVRTPQTHFKHNKAAYEIAILKNRKTDILCQEFVSRNVKIRQNRAKMTMFWTPPRPKTPTMRGIGLRNLKNQWKSPNLHVNYAKTTKFNVAQSPYTHDIYQIQQSCLWNVVFAGLNSGMSLPDFGMSARWENPENMRKWHFYPHLPSKQGHRCCLWDDGAGKHSQKTCKKHVHKNIDTENSHNCTELLQF